MLCSPDDSTRKCRKKPTWFGHQRLRAQGGQENHCFLLTLHCIAWLNPLPASPSTFAIIINATIVRKDAGMQLTALGACFLSQRKRLLQPFCCPSPFGVVAMMLRAKWIPTTNPDNESDRSANRDSSSALGYAQHQTVVFDRCPADWSDALGTRLKLEGPSRWAKLSSANSTQTSR